MHFKMGCFFAFPSSLFEAEPKSKPDTAEKPEATRLALSFTTFLLLRQSALAAQASVLVLEHIRPASTSGLPLTILSSGSADIPMANSVICFKVWLNCHLLSEAHLAPLLSVLHRTSNVLADSLLYYSDGKLLARGWVRDFSLICSLKHPQTRS